MLSHEQKDTFKKEGLILLPGLWPVEKAKIGRERILAICEKERCYKDGQWHFCTPLAIRRLGKQILKSNTIGSLMTIELDKCITDLVDGRDVRERTMGANLLLTLPHNKGSRRDLDWHLDAPSLSGFDTAGVQLFTFLDSVRPGGGGPIAVTGSHRIETPENLTRQGVRKQLSEIAFFDDLLKKAHGDRDEIIGKKAKIDGIEVEVVEMVGEPGDVYFMDLWVFYTRFPNCSSVARMMLTQRFWLQEVYQRLGPRIA